VQLVEWWGRGVEWSQYGDGCVLCVFSVGGLGMRVVGGKLGHDKKLGTYVSTVVCGGVADLAGIVEGMYDIRDVHHMFSVYC